MGFTRIKAGPDIQELEGQKCACPLALGSPFRVPNTNAMGR
jgi:hypothetical protein